MTIKHTFYPDGDNGFIPDVQLVKVEGDSVDMAVSFTWRGSSQWLKMSKDNEYDDTFWLVVETKYTKDFSEWLDENLSGYDSLEGMFGEVEDLIPSTYTLTFEENN